MFKLIVGLGNPGEKYKNNRHNTGFILLDAFAEKNDLDWKYEKKFNAEVAKWGNMLLAKPQTFMNNSGESVAKLANYHKLPLSQVLVVHDDVDLEFGGAKVVKGSSSAGHLGVENVIRMLGSSDFHRLRVGISRPMDVRHDVEDWVLGDFPDEQLTELKENLFLEHLLLST